MTMVTRITKEVLGGDGFCDDIDNDNDVEKKEDVE